MEGSSEIWREVAKRIAGVEPGGITGGGGQGLGPSGGVLSAAGGHGAGSLAEQGGGSQCPVE